MIEHLGYTEEAGRMQSAVDYCLLNSDLTADLGGKGTTESVTDAIIAKL